MSVKKAHFGRFIIETLTLSHFYNFRRYKHFSFDFSSKKLKNMLIKKIKIIVFIASVFFSKITAQKYADSSNLEVSIDKNILVGTQPKESQLVEPHLAAHPTNPNKLIAAAAVVSTSQRTNLDIEHCVVFLSDDAGKSWIRKDLTGQAGLDAWVAFSEKNILVTTLGPHKIYDEYKFNDGNQLLVYLSEDGGINWVKTPQTLGSNHDGPRSVVGKNGEIFITSHRSNLPNVNTQIYVAKLDYKNLVERTTYVNPSNLNIAVDGITAYNDGTIAISFQDFQYPITGSLKDENGNWRGPIKTRREWLVTSSDNGKTFTPPKLITEKFFDRANDLIVDRTDKKFKDRLYCVGSNKDYESILITYSDDKGYTWSDAKAIEKKELKGIRIEPQVAVNKDGILAIAWFDSRDNAESKLCYSPYISFSSDGGETFNKPRKVADKKSCLNPEIAGENVTRRWPEGGDYFGLSASADGKFHVLWPDARSGKFELMTAAITVKKN